jgi:hypothetical protein
MLLSIFAEHLPPFQFMKALSEDSRKYQINKHSQW